MPIQIGICDDNEEDLRLLAKALFSYDSSFQVSLYTDGESLLEDCLEKRRLFDILFLDIYMPELNGIETARKIRTEMKDARIIFVSSSNEHYPEAYDVFAFNYILKPLNLERLNRVLDEALSSIESDRQQQISFNYKAKNYRINCKDILYIESRNKLIYFHMTDKTTLQCYAKLDEILEQLPEESFVRCHQSYVVNVFYVTEMSNHYFKIGSTMISISKKYLKLSKDKYFAFTFLS